MEDRKLAVAIAKDVLKQLRARRYLAQPGVYLEADGAKVKGGDDLRKVLPKIKKCHVCAIGAAFLSYVRLKDGVKVVAADGWPAGSRPPAFVHPEGSHTLFSGRASAMRDLLVQAFDRDMLSDIESAFESNWGGYRTAGNRLRAIMLNIIRNKGKFEPDQERHRA